MNRADKGQSTLEYACLILIVLSASISMHVYIQRARQGSLKRATDQISSGTFYSPRAVEAGSYSTITQSVSETNSQRQKKYPTADDWDARISVSEYQVNKTRTASRDEKIVSLAKEPNG